MYKPNLKYRKFPYKIYIGWYCVNNHYLEKIKFFLFAKEHFKNAKN